MAIWGSAITWQILFCSAHTLEKHLLLTCLSQNSVCEPLLIADGVKLPAQICWWWGLPMSLIVMLSLLDHYRWLVRWTVVFRCIQENLFMLHRAAGFVIVRGEYVGIVYMYTFRVCQLIINGLVLLLASLGTMCFSPVNTNKTQTLQC